MPKTQNKKVEQAASALMREGDRMLDTRHYSEQTWVRMYLPWGTFTRAKLLCSDGKLRLTRRISEFGDTFYTVPCAVQVKNITVSGFMYLDDNVAKFQATGKNRDKLPEWTTGAKNASSV